MRIKMKQGNARVDCVCALCITMSLDEGTLMDVRFAKESANKIESLGPPPDREGTFSYG